MLPFEKSSGRKYQCFVCGEQFEELAQFNGHIKSAHDEGREFLVCPVEWCGSCVRDMRQHFRSRHPHTPLPKDGQMKVMIWQDFGARGKAGKKVKFREGYFASAKNGRAVHYRSGYEESVYSILEQMPDVLSYREEPFSVKYSDMGAVHDYFPDLSVTFADGRTEIWEIKPANQTALRKNKNKWAAAKQYCEARGLQFMVVTEQGIAKLKKGLRLE